MKKGIIVVLSAFIGAAVGAVAVRKTALEINEKTIAMSNKHLALFLMMNQWMKMKQEGKDLASYFVENGYRKIAVYGLSYAGETLLGELRGTGIEVAYAIDRNANSIYAGIKVVTLENELAAVDAVIVTAITYFDEVESLLRMKMSCPILSLENILFEI